MPREQLRAKTTLRHWWHSLPWNGVFWGTVIFLFVTAGVMAVRAELDFVRMLGIDDTQLAEIVEGDPIKIVFILNGDEIVVQKDGRRARLRMLGIRSFDPVVNEREITAFGDASVSFLEEWVLNKIVHVHFDAPIRDEHGRYLGYIQLENIDINRRMVTEGIAMVYTEYLTEREQEYLIAEVPARRTKRGVWGGHKATARITALRREWANLRKARGDEQPVDPLLEPLR